MRTPILVVVVSATAAFAAQQRGAVSSVSVSAPQSGVVAVTVSGTNPCGAVNIDYGDGAAITHPISRLPMTVRHEYAQPGQYRVRARGMGNCDGVATAAVRLDTPPGAQAPAGMRFPGMDRDGDGVITRQEWRGSAQSFRVHDWNGDGVLSGDEVRAGARRRDEDPDYAAGRNVMDDWSERRFKQLDHNSDNRISRDEWHYDAEAFVRADRNRDGTLSRAEFLNPIDDDRSDQFDYLDLNGDGRIRLNEWHGSRATFDWLDRNNDGMLTRAEVAGQDLGSGTNDEFSSLDMNRDRSVSREEWHWSSASFDRLDVNRDGRLSRGEFEAAGPLDQSGTSAPIVVSAEDRWTDTGITVRAGERLTFAANGTIQLSEDGSDIAEPAGARSGRRAPDAPMPNALAGALIARIGNGAPFLIGGGTRSIAAPRAGRLYLGVNDDHLADNGGEFRVTVTVRR